MTLGYDKPLYILAFDHRGSFQKGLFGVSGRKPTPEEDERISDAKQTIYTGFERAAAEGAPAGQAGVLVDEQYGADVARSARAAGYVFAMPVEKSGQDEFDFEYGEEFGAHIEAFDPTFAKVLVRYNPEDDPELNARQAERLARLSDWLHANDRKFLFELLVPPTEAQLEAAAGDKAHFDQEIRPGLVVQAIREAQEAGIGTDIWKIEGLNKREDCERVSAQARAGGRDGVVCVVLGRGADRDAVVRWLEAGAGVPGYAGFAIGRTIWWDALTEYIAGNASRDEAAERIAGNYLGMIEAYTGAASTVSA
jgi:myo-inositol catabolism protein IolC